MEKKIIDARVGLGFFYSSMMYHVEAKEAVEPIVELAMERNYRKRLARIYTIMGCYDCFVVEDYPKGVEYLEDALTIAEESNDILSLAMARAWLGVALSLSCEFEKSLNHYKKALEINAAANIPWGISMVKSNIGLNVYDFQGKINLGYQTTDEALRIAEESGDIWSKAIAYTAHGYSCYCKGHLDEAEVNLLRAADYCDRINLFWWGTAANLWLGETYVERGEYQKSQDYYSKAISISERGRLWPYLIGLGKIALARAKVVNDEKDVHLEQLNELEAANKVRWAQGQMAKCIGEILLNNDDQHMAEAEDWIKKAIEADKRNGMMFHLAKDYAAYAELFKRKGDTPKAKENLSKAIEIYKECGAEGWVTKAEEALAKI